ncbi:MAG: iron-containing alcohol dehydrogenase, partial [Pseudomonadota bacterium]
SFPTTIRFGAGRMVELPKSISTAGMERPLFVTDKGLAALPLTDTVRAHLPTGAGLFTGVSPNPKDSDLGAGIEAYRAGRHDGVVAFGGGSALDLGKLIAFQAGQTRPIWDFEDVGDWWKRADADAIAPIIALPTTAGTGSEVGRAAVLTDTARRVKKVIFHPRMLPVTVIADPVLTAGMPRAITAGTGMDAFAHCLEAYCAPGYHPICAGIALEGMRLVKDALPRACAEPGDLDARADMMTAAMAGAIAFQRGLGAIHALSHPIGALYDTHHGTTNAVLTPAVLRWNRPVIEDRIVRAAAYLGLRPSFDAFTAWIDGVRQGVGLPGTLRELNVERDAFDTIARMAPDDPTAGGNPQPVTPQGAREVLEAAW